MTADENQGKQVEALLATANLADALESEEFKHFLDQIPIAIIVSEMKGRERIAYANPEFEKISGHVAANVEGASWDFLKGRAEGEGTRKLGEAVVEFNDFIGTFRIE